MPFCILEQKYITQLWKTTSLIYSTFLCFYLRGNGWGGFPHGRKFIIWMMIVRKETPINTLLLALSCIKEHTLYSLQVGQRRNEPKRTGYIRHDGPSPSISVIPHPYAKAKQMIEWRKEEIANKLWKKPKELTMIVAMLIFKNVKPGIPLASRSTHPCRTGNRRAISARIWSNNAVGKSSFACQFETICKHVILLNNKLIT